MSNSVEQSPTFTIGVKVVDGQPVLFASGTLEARLAEQVAGHLASLASATRDEARGAFFG